MVKGKVLFIHFILLMAFTSQTLWAQAEGYRQLTLENAIQTALIKNRDIIIAQEEISKADYQIMEAASGALPQLHGFWDSQKVLKPLVFVIQFPDSTGKLQKNRLKVGTDYNMGFGANLTQQLYVGGKIGTALKAAKIYKNVSYETMNSIKQNVVTGVVQAFFGVLLAEEISIISQESLEQAKKHYENVRKLYEAGVATDYDLLRAKVNVSNLKPNVIEARNNIRISLLRMKEIMGLDPETTLDINGSFSEPDTKLLEMATKQVAFTNRPDLKASELTVDLYEKNIKIVKGDFLPTLTASSIFQYSGNLDELTYHASDWTPYWFATLNLSFPIFTGFKNYSKYKQAKVDHLKAKTDYRKQRDAAEIEVSEAVMNLQKTIEKIESQKLNVEEAKEAFRLAESLYTNGKVTQLDVLDAQLARDVAKNNMANALFEGKIAEISLKNSLGIIKID